MRAVEFTTKKKQGGMIQIPEEYISEVSGEFRVIIIINAEPKKKLLARENSRH
jgi:hypothetical protein